MPLITAGIEGVLNTFLWRDRSLKSARQRLQGKTLRVSLEEFSAPLVMAFSELQLDVLSQWEGEADCHVTTRLGVLPKLRDRQQITALIRSAELEVEGDIQVVRNLASLMELAEFDPAELLAPYIGDIASESISKIVRRGGKLLQKGFIRNQQYLGEVLTEEWRVAPGSLEVAWFAEETEALARSVDALSERLDKLEGK